MSRKGTGLVLIVIGLIVLIVFATADITGLGNDPNTFGWIQWIGVVAGVVVALIGAYIRSRAA
jgi:hypothetical protein